MGEEPEEPWKSKEGRRCGVCGKQANPYIDTMTFNSALTRKVLVVTQGLKDFSSFWTPMALMA